MNRFLLWILVLFGVKTLVLSQNHLSVFFQDNEWASTLIGISVKEVSTQKVIFEKNSHLSLCPASTFKLMTTAAALEKLGANFRFKTEIFYTGEIKNKTLMGDLIVKGYGDPTIESRFFQGPSLQDIVRLIQNKGIEKITGYIVIDNSYFNPKVPDNWIWEDINNYYAAVPHPINILDNEFHIYLQSGKENAPVSILKIDPQYQTAPFLEITHNEVNARQGGDNAYIYGDPQGYQKRLRGSIPPFQKKYSIEGALPDPARMFAQKLTERLLSASIVLNKRQGLVINTDTLNYKKAVLLGSITSPPLSEIIRVMNLHSVNLLAESIVYALGKGNYENGKKILRTFLKQSGLNTNELYIDDGCGLSRVNSLSADVLSQLLVQMYQSAHKETFIHSLPIAGESGTMKRFAKTAPLKGNLKCKTGSIQRVRSYAGYLTTKTGRLFAFAIIFNNLNSSSRKVKNTLRKFLETLYQNF